MLHDYCLPHKEFVGRVRANRGIKQGARDVPFLWIAYMYHFLHQFLATHSIDWIRHHIIVLLMIFIFDGSRILNTLPLKPYRI